jgi:glycyl-tRNA synthetase alpha chain
MSAAKPQCLQDLMLALMNFWAAHGCILGQPYDVEKGAGTMNPETFFRVLGPEPWRAAYVEPSRRPKDGRYGDNPQRVEKHLQYQVILKPSPADVQELYLDSLRAIGLNLDEHDIRFEEDNWEAPTLGAWGVGWQVILDGTEISQFTYFQQSGGIELKPITVELTYGLERLTMFLLGVGNIFELPWNSGGAGGEVKTYGQVRLESERQFSKYNFELAEPKFLLEQFDRYEAEAQRLIAAGLPLVAHDFVLKSSHTFNTLDARGAIGVSQRAAYIQRVRALACAEAKVYVESRWPATQTA